MPKLIAFRLNIDSNQRLYIIIQLEWFTEESSTITLRSTLLNGLQPFPTLKPQNPSSVQNHSFRPPCSSGLEMECSPLDKKRMETCWRGLQLQLGLPILYLRIEFRNLGWVLLPRPLYLSKK